MVVTAWEVVVVVDAAVVTVVAAVVSVVVGAVSEDEVVGASSWPEQAVTTASNITRVLPIGSQGIPVASMADNA